MAEIRFYCLVAVRGIERAQWIYAASDRDAIAFARDRKPTVDCELWEGARLVARIPADKR